MYKWKLADIRLEERLCKLCNPYEVEGEFHLLCIGVLNYRKICFVRQPMLVGFYVTGHWKNVILLKTLNNYNAIKYIQEGCFHISCCFLFPELSNQEANISRILLFVIFPLSVYIYASPFWCDPTLVLMQLFVCQMTHKWAGNGRLI